jgi:hypothetical protein
MILQVNLTSHDFCAYHWIAAFQECDARTLPQTNAEYLPGEVSCDPTTLYGDAMVSHMLRIGVYCDDADYGQDFYYSDQNFECAVENEFLISEKKDNDFALYTCSETAIFPQNSDGTAQSIDRVFIQTDTRWLQYEEDDEYGGHCHSRRFVPPTTPPISTVSPSTIEPTTSNPSSPPSTSNDEKGTPVAAIAGVVVGGMVVIVLLVVAIVLFRRSSNPQGSGALKREVIQEPTDSNDHSEENPNMISVQTASMGSSSPRSANRVENDFVHQSGVPAMLEARYNNTGLGYPVEEVPTIQSFQRSSQGACPETGTVRSDPQPVSRPTDYRPGYKDQARTVMAYTMAHGDDLRMGSDSPGAARQSLNPPSRIVKPSLVVHAVPMADVIYPVDNPRGILPTGPDSVNSARRPTLDP